MCHQQVLSCHSASTVSHVERAEDTRIPPWQTKGGRETPVKQSPKNILLMMMYQFPRPHDTYCSYISASHAPHANIKKKTKQVHII